MELIDTVIMFAAETFTDAFNVGTTFVGKVNPFAEVTNSGSSSQRRILETPVDQTVPAARVVIAPSLQKFLVAAMNIDFWNGAKIRHKYSMLPVEDVLGAVDDIGNTLASTQADTATYCFPYFVRREIDEDEMSDYLSGYELYFSQVKSFVRGEILKFGTTYYRFKTDTWIDGAGFSVCQAVKLEDPVQAFDVTTKGAYDEVNDVYAPTVVSSVSCFVEPLKQDYEFVTPSFTQIEEGDKAISLLKSAAVVAVNTEIGDYRVQGIRDFGTWVTCQCRKLS